MTSAFLVFFRKMLMSANFTVRKGNFLPGYKENIEYYHTAKFYPQSSDLRLDIAILKFADISKNDICPKQWI